MTIPEPLDIDSTGRADLMVWWTSQAECEVLTAMNPLWSDYDATLDGVPNYIHKEFCSRYGRNGRGRLWSDDKFGDVGIPWDTTKPAARLAGERGGIVIWATDAVHVFGLPGFLTDLRLNFANALEAQP
jgi:hypothetical protein